MDQLISSQLVGDASSPFLSLYRLAARALAWADGSVWPTATSHHPTCKLIGAESLDAVTLRHTGEPFHVMWVDDDSASTGKCSAPATPTRWQMPPKVAQSVEKGSDGCAR
jgi:hypothetical protein